MSALHLCMGHGRSITNVTAPSHCTQTRDRGHVIDARERKRAEVERARAHTHPMWAGFVAACAQMARDLVTVIIGPETPNDYVLRPEPTRS